MSHREDGATARKVTAKPVLGSVPDTGAVFHGRGDDLYERHFRGNETDATGNEQDVQFIRPGVL